MIRLLLSGMVLRPLSLGAKGHVPLKNKTKQNKTQKTKPAVFNQMYCMFNFWCPMDPGQIIFSIPLSKNESSYPKHLLLEALLVKLEQELL